MAIAGVAFFTSISAYKMYWGGWAFGPRHLIPALFLLFYEGLLWFERSSSPKWLIFTLSSIGVFDAWLKQFPAYLNRWDSQQARNEGVFAH
jgi:hypothetical protein